MQLPAMVGKYELLEFLGGGMSHVYRARDTVIDRPVVVKILTDQSCSDPEAKARFLQEARLAGNIQHENIVSVFDYGEHGGHPYIVMEYLKGEDLREALHGGRAGSLFERMKIALQLAEALEYVHGRDVVHRDIKPENIHIDPNGRVKLMDFGIAKAANLSLTRTGMAMGTPFYMAPEQVAGRGTTARVDVYAFGMLFYELLTGVRGITGETMEQVFFQILNQPLDAAAMENAGAPPPVRDLVLRCTAKKAEDRPPGFHAIVEELKGMIAAATGSKTQAVKMPQAATTPLTAKPARSGRRWWVAGVAATAAVVVILLSVYWLRRPPPIPGMIYISAGTFLSGPDNQPVKLGAFYIDETEVSNAEFAEFCRVTGCPAPQGAAELPVVRVTVDQARAYARSKGKRLPAALEWERAARGTKGLKYPWGDADDATRANLRDNPSLNQHALMPVRSAAGQPPYHMAGNAWEMVEGSVTPSEAAVAMFLTLLAPPPTAQEKWIEIRGGSFNTPLAAAVSYEWSPIPERFSSADIGFRCAKDP
jgi:formylglycine-generating enzyme required for sulfatase activity/tRNA A-37 threonylcarbamoyl transferase component Bud32